MKFKEFIGNDAKIINDLLLQKNMTSYLNTGYLIEHYTSGINGEPLYLKISEDKGIFNTNLFNYESFEGIKIITTLYFTAKKTFQGVYAFRDELFEFVIDCLTLAGIKNFNNSTLRHWFASYFRRNYVCCDFTQQYAKLTRPIRINYLGVNVPHFSRACLNSS